MQDNTRGRRHRGGIRELLAARRGQRIRPSIAAVVWTTAGDFGLEDPTPLQDARCVVLRMLGREGERPLAGLTVYRPHFRMADGVVLLRPEQAEAMYDIRAAFDDPGRRGLERDNTLMQAALSLCDVHADDSGEPPLTVPPLPEVYFGYRTFPAAERTPALLRAARAKYGTDEPGQDELAASLEERAVQDGDGMWLLPAEFFARRPGAVHAAHPLDGSAPPAVDAREGAVADGWVRRYGVWTPRIQVPDRVFISREGLAGTEIPDDNPAGPLLAHMGLLDPRDDPRRWGSERQAEHAAAMVDPSLYTPAADGGPSVMETLDRRLECNIRRTKLYSQEDRLRMLRNPGCRPYSSKASVPFLVRNDAESLVFRGPGWDANLHAEPPQFAVMRSWAMAPAVV